MRNVSCLDSFSNLFGVFLHFMDLGLASVVKGGPSPKKVESIVQYTSARWRKSIVERRIPSLASAFVVVAYQHFSAIYHPDIHLIRLLPSRIRYTVTPMDRNPSACSRSLRRSVHNRQTRRSLAAAAQNRFGLAGFRGDAWFQATSPGPAWRPCATIAQPEIGPARPVAMPVGSLQ